jgi:hypothetical protein
VFLNSTPQNKNGAAQCICAVNYYLKKVAEFEINGMNFQKLNLLIIW